MKTCLQCGRKFGDGVTVCSFDGAPLPDSGGRTATARRTAGATAPGRREDGLRQVIVWAIAMMFAKGLPEILWLIMVKTLELNDRRLGVAATVIFYVAEGTLVGLVSAALLSQWLADPLILVPLTVAGTVAGWQASVVLIPALHVESRLMGQLVAGVVSGASVAALQLIGLARSFRGWGWWPIASAIGSIGLVWGAFGGGGGTGWLFQSPFPSIAVGLTLGLAQGAALTNLLKPKNLYRQRDN